ncbi:adenylyltransferase/cytidyltransferase family protein [Candidatus Peregrinibacteria bacterium]|nr:adenylyltransferase/cytidyltransferase family protein [Candidatus Peregrinibacteria bacterium]
MAFGTFDHFHAGHEACLQQAKALGDILIVVVALDQTVRLIKGKSPDQTEKERRNTVKMSRLADKVVLGKPGDKYEVIRRYRPHIIALGYDQFTFTLRLRKFLIDHGMDTTIVRLQAYRPTIFKTSLLRKKADLSSSMV